MIEQPVDEDTLSDCNSGKSSRSNSMVEQSYHHGELDQLTLELLMNKNHYHKYMSAANPDKFAKREAYLADLKNTQITTDIANIFEAYTKTIIEHVKHSASRCDADVEPFDDTLFGTIDETDNQDRNDPPPSQSFWGKERVVRRGHNQTQLQYDLNVFSRSTR
jgi:hypothetical protein